MLSTDFNWTTPDGVTRTAHVNNGAHLTIEDFKYAWGETRDNPIRFVFISLTSARIFQRTLDAIKDYVADDVIVFVDAATGMLLENKVQRVLAQLICLSMYANGIEVVFSDKQAGFHCNHSKVLLEIGYTGTAWVQANKDRQFQKHYVLAQIQSCLTNEIVNVSIVSRARDQEHFRYHCKLWNHYIETCLDLLSIAHGRPDYSHLTSTEGPSQFLSDSPTQYIFRNMLNDLLSIMIQTSGTKVFTEIFGSSNDVLKCSAIKKWVHARARNTHTIFLSTYGNYALALLYQMILISDQTSLQCSTFEFVYAQLCRMLSSSGRLCPLTKWARDDLSPNRVRFDEVSLHNPGWWHISSCRAFLFLETTSPNLASNAVQRQNRDFDQALTEVPVDMTIREVQQNKDPSAHHVLPGAVVGGQVLGEGDVELLQNEGPSANSVSPDALVGDQALGQGGEGDDGMPYYDAILHFVEQPSVRNQDIAQEVLDPSKGEVEGHVPFNAVDALVEETHHLNPAAADILMDTIQLVIDNQGLLGLPVDGEYAWLVDAYGEDARVSCCKRDIYLRRGSRWFSDELYNVDIDDQLFRVLNVEKDDDWIEHATLINSRFPGPMEASPKLAPQTRNLLSYQRKRQSSENTEPQNIRILANVWRESFLNAVKGRNILWSTRDQYGGVTDPGSIPVALMNVVDML